jgi:pyruvate,water dikinase
MSAIHRESCPDAVAWSTINAGEAIPGVVTPLTWSFFGDAVERAMKQTFCDIGTLAPSEVVAERDPERRLWDVFYGRAAGNLNTFRMLGDRMPGSSGDAVEEQIFGQVREGVRSDPDRSRYPVVAAKLPWAAAMLCRRLETACRPIPGWWRAAVAPGALGSRPAAQAALGQAAAGFERVMRPHTLVAMLCQALYEQLRRCAARAGREGLELSLVTGYGQMAETDVAADLFEVSRGRLDLDGFVARHGYHGPDEGELSSHVWRMNREPLTRLLTTYEQLGDERDPRRLELERANDRRRAEAELLAALAGPRRAGARAIIRLAARFIPLRGTGKAAFLQCVDVARAAAWAIGEDMARTGELAAAGDAFMLTLDELLSASESASAGEPAAERRAAHDAYRQLDIPDFFYGVPEPFGIDKHAEPVSDRDLIEGTPVSPGVVEGVVRLVLDPQTDETLELGEILVCRTTDPSWASIMMPAAALVIDIGGAMSHGAIVARELGIPCVIGTRDGTARLRTGDRVEVDSTSGRVRLLARAGKLLDDQSRQPV